MRARARARLRSGSGNRSHESDYYFAEAALIPHDDARRIISGKKIAARFRARLRALYLRTLYLARNRCGEPELLRLVFRRALRNTVSILQISLWFYANCVRGAYAEAAMLQQRCCIAEISR